MVLKRCDPLHSATGGVVQVVSSVGPRNYPPFVFGLAFHKAKAALHSTGPSLNDKGLSHTTRH